MSDVEAFVLLITFLIFVCQHGPVDAVHAVKGTTPPRYKTKAAAAARTGTAWTPPAYGTKEWFADLRSDALAANTDWRRRRAVRKAQEREAAPVVATAPARQDAPQVDPWDDAEPFDDEPTSVVHDGTSVDYRNAGKWGWSCRRSVCPGKGFDYDTNEEARAAAAAHRCKDTGTLPTEGVQILGGGVTAPTTPATPPDGQPTTCQADDGHLADVIPLFKPFNKEDNTMPIDANPEVQGLVQSIAHAELMLEAGQQLGTPGGEQFLAHLVESDNGEATVAAANAAQQAFDNAALEAQTLVELLKAQMQVKEASDAIGGEHGSKEYMGAGQ